MKIFKPLMLLAVVAMVAVFGACGPKYSYESVEGDPLNARIYTLDNGLKVYMTVNDEEPRIQTFIAVRVGAKNDPAETTGLAHYFEHLMFKGTKQFGTKDFEAEKPLLDEIERLFEVYRQTTDEAQRAAIYRTIDSISYEASKLAIPNEYDKLMSAIGSSGTNAYTGYDQTVYIENIPSNQIENWAMIEADRFENVVVRGFHTELETIYEEKNMSLTQDSRKVSEAMLSELFPNHPYGRQTVLGTQEHLKNPSITDVYKYQAKWYVPNNIAICLSGDFDPEEMIRVIDKYFGAMKPNPELSKLDFPEERPITQPISRDVWGLDAPSVTLAWRSQGATDHMSEIAAMASSIFSNRMAGLIDTELNQRQKVLSARGGAQTFTDHGIFTAQGSPKAGQSLDEVKDLLLETVAKLRGGEFDESLLEAAVNNFKARQMNSLDANGGRANAFVNSFIDGTEWADAVHMLDRMSRITKDDVVAWANENLRDDNYVVVYKRQGPDPDEKKMSKPQITPIVTNRDAASDFLVRVQNSVVKPIEPVFVDFDRDMSKLRGQSDIEVLYKKNETNDLFTLTYMFEVGSDHNPLLRLMTTYADYLGTADKSAEDIKRELYNIACSYNISVGANRTTVEISGLSENMGRAMEIFEDFVADVKGNDAVLAAVKANQLKSRENAKAAQTSNERALVTYITYGPEYIARTVLTDNRLRGITSDELIGSLKELLNHEHRVLYYGPLGDAEFLAELEKHHNAGALKPVVGNENVKPLLTPVNGVYLADYNAAQIRYTQYSNNGKVYDTANDAVLMLYNEYFGGGMGSIVFQEMREARGLAYSARASLATPRTADDYYTFTATIATQNDKMGQAIDAFEEIINDMPQSEAAFNIARESIDQSLRTRRTIKADVLNSYISALDKGVDYDRNRDIFEKVQTMTLDGVAAFQREWIRNRTYSYGILGDVEELDMERLRALGPVKILTPKEIFGY